MGTKLTLSVDDGHPLDLKVARILANKGLSCTFYIPIKNREQKTLLTKNQIKTLAKNFEIGAHAYLHRDLTMLSEERVFDDMKKAKEQLQEIIGKEVTSFAPPGGKYNHTVIAVAKRLGFRDFRSARIFNFGSFGRKKFVWHPNLHLYPHSRCTDLIHCLKNADSVSFLKRLKHWPLEHLDFYPILKKSRQPIHVWMHSWEIEKYGLWNFLENL